MHQKNTLWSVLIFTFLLCACTGNTSTTPAQDVNTILTFGVETLVASVFQTQTAMWTPEVESIAPTIVPSEPPVPTFLVPTSTPIYLRRCPERGTPSLTPSPTGTYYTATVDPAFWPMGVTTWRLSAMYPSLMGKFSGLARALRKPGRLRTAERVNGCININWLFSVETKWAGNQEGIGKVIPEGKWTELSLSLKAPDSTRTYTGYWRFADPDGNMFGATLSVSVKVGIPTDTPALTSTPTAMPTPTLPPTSTFTATTEPPVSYPNN